MLNAFDGWMKQKAQDPRGHSSRGWSHANGLIEQRLYEVARLVRQFKSTLQDAGLLTAAVDAADAADVDSGDGDEDGKEGTSGPAVNEGGGRKRARATGECSMPCS